MQKIEKIPPMVCHNLQGIFFDIDDTVTSEGKLLSSSYSALWKAREAGLKLVAVTGRPAGWVDHIARMWPVDAVIGENGAFYFWMAKGKMQRYFIQDLQTREENQVRLQKIQKEVLESFPQAALSSDQKYRANDLAIDFCEDIPPMNRSDVEKIALIFEKHQAQAKISSIHVNGWFGDFNKQTTCQHLIENLWQENFSEAVNKYIYCGDSPNDEPMFAIFPHSVGVANIRPWLDVIKNHPTYCTEREGGDGFAELVEIVLKTREQTPYEK